MRIPTTARSPVPSRRAHLGVVAALLLSMAACAAPELGAHDQALCQMIGGSPCPRVCPHTTDGPDCADPACAHDPQCQGGGGGGPDAGDGGDAGEGTDAGGGDGGTDGSDGACGQGPGGQPDCEDPDCTVADGCDGTCDQGADGQPDCEDPDCTAADGCDGACEQGVDGQANCEDPDCTAADGCGDGECGTTTDDTGGEVPDCDDPDCAESGQCPDGECSQAAGGDGEPDGPNCDDVDCAGEPGCPDDECPQTDDGAPDCADEACASECDGDGDDDGGDVDERPPIEWEFPHVLALQTIQPFNRNAYIQEILATPPWNAAAQDWGFVNLVNNIVYALWISANTEPPWHVISNGLELVNGLWRPGKALTTLEASKQYRSWLEISSGGNRIIGPRITCQDGKVQEVYGGDAVSSRLRTSHGYTPPLFDAGEPHASSPEASYRVLPAGNGVILKARVRGRINAQARWVGFQAMWYDAPFIDSQVRYELRCDGTYDLEAYASNFPTVTLYIDRKFVTWRVQNGFTAFIKSGGGIYNPPGAGFTAPGSVYYNGGGQGQRLQ